MVVANKALACHVFGVDVPLAQLLTGHRNAEKTNNMLTPTSKKCRESGQDFDGKLTCSVSVIPLTAFDTASKGKYFAYTGIQHGVLTAYDMQYKFSMS